MAPLWVFSMYVLGFTGLLVTHGKDTKGNKEDSKEVGSNTQLMAD